MLTEVIERTGMIIAMSIMDELARARVSASLTQTEVAIRAGISRMSVQNAEARNNDPKLSTLEVLARALGKEIMLVPAQLRPSLEDFIRAGGKVLGQPPGVEAPRSAVGVLIQPRIRVPRTKKDN